MSLKDYYLMILCINLRFIMLLFANILPILIYWIDELRLFIIILSQISDSFLAIINILSILIHYPF